MGHTESLSALQQENKRLTSALEASMAGLFVVDETLAIRFVNPALLKIIGFTANDILNKSFAALVDTTKHEHEDYIARLFSRARSGESIVEEMILKKKDGSPVWVWVQLSIVEDQEGAFDGFVGALRDITKQKQAERELNETKELLEESQRIAQLGSWSWDVRENEIVWTDELYEIFGLPKNYEPTSEQYIPFVYEEDRSRSRRMLEEALKEGKDFECRCRFVRTDGEIGWMRTIGKTTLNRQKKVEHIHGVVQDITELNNIEQEMKQRADESERVNRLMVNRELKMRELKTKLKEVEEELHTCRSQIPE